MSVTLPSSIGGFVPIPVAYSKTATHIIYARAHTGPKKSKDKEIAFPEGRTLFIVNVPPDATEREIILLFKQSGTVERVVFSDQDVDEGVSENDEDEDVDGDVEENADEEGVEEQPRKKRKVASKDPKQTAPQVVLLPHVNIRTLRRTGRTAHIVFLDSSSRK